MLLRSYTLKIEFPPCDFSAQTVNAIAELSDDVREVLPYLNAVIDKCTYLPEACILRFNREGKVINIYPRMITITKLTGKQEAEQTMVLLKQFINDTYDRRDKIKPVYQACGEIKVRDIFNLLPGTNCKQCGLPTCFAFATKLVKRNIEITNCKPIYFDQYMEKRKKLIELLKKYGFL